MTREINRKLLDNSLDFNEMIFPLQAILLDKFELTDHPSQKKIKRKSIFFLGYFTQKNIFDNAIGGKKEE